jgi:hypothetical protein
MKLQLEIKSFNIESAFQKEEKKGPPRRRPFLLIYLASLKNKIFNYLFPLR